MASQARSMASSIVMLPVVINVFPIAGANAEANAE